MMAAWKGGREEVMPNLFKHHILYIEPIAKKENQENTTLIIISHSDNNPPPHITPTSSRAHPCQLEVIKAAKLLFSFPVYAIPVAPVPFD
jgi:hypothetical protein